MSQTKDSIEYFRRRSSPVALAALALFDNEERDRAYKSLKEDQSKDGSWADSLAETVRRLDLLARLGYDSSDPHVGAAVEWILWRQGLPNSYRRAFPAPTDSELRNPLVLPTGEKIPSMISYRHIYGELALRALLDVGIRDDPRVADMVASLDLMVRNSKSGVYCCKTCTGAFWQGAACFPRYRAHVAQGIKTLATHRSASGNWRGFPFFFILETLGKIRGMQALEEFEFTLPRLVRSVGRDGSWGRTGKDEKTFAVLSGIHSLRIGEV